jgi:hypothetical protein
MNAAKLNVDKRLADTGRRRGLKMAKIYYAGGSSSSTGILRCILSGSQLPSMMGTQRFTSLGDTFPSDCKGGPPTTILEILPDECSASCKSGFYRAEQPPLQFEETLRALEESREPSSRR